MAIPKVFVSSTCYDLAEERAQLERFISVYGFQPVLSEYSDVFYDPDEHTHNACVKEVEHCDLFVLIISGRFGGKLKGGDGESITQAEYNAARSLNIPIFAFVKSDVLQAQHYFKENLRSQDEGFAKKIVYPAITAQNDAMSIFSFIQQVQRSQTNNAIESYGSFSDIETHLKKQWAGLFYAFLQKRKEQDKVSNITKALEKLSGSTLKLESLVESLHNDSVGTEETKDILNRSEIKTQTYDFFSLIKQYVSFSNDIDNFQFFNLEQIKEMSEIPINETWEEYLNQTVMFKIHDIKGERGITFNKASYFKPMKRSDEVEIKYCYENGIKKSDDKLRFDVLMDVFSEYLI